MYRNKKVIHIVAAAKNGVIGNKGDLCWRLTEDLQYFKEKTLGHVCLAGRKTVESFPKPLERRTILCISSNKRNTGDKHSLKAMNLDTAFICAQWQSNQLKTNEIFIIGGSQIYKATEDIVDELWITEIDGEFDGDTFYSKPKGFKMYEHTDWMRGTCKKTMKTLAYRFTKWCKE